MRSDLNTCIYDICFFGHKYGVKLHLYIKFRLGNLTSNTLFLYPNVFMTKLRVREIEECIAQQIGSGENAKRLCLGPS